MNGDTIVDALRAAGQPGDVNVQLVNPGGNNPWLFSWPASSVANAGAPVVLTVPTVAANAVEISALSGENDSHQSFWVADGHMFNVRIVGNVAPSVFGKTLKLYLWAGNGLDGSAGATGEKLLGQGSATLPLQATNDANANFYLQAQCLWESNSLYMNGTFSGQIAGTLLPLTAFNVYNPSRWVAQQAAGAYLPISFVCGVNLASSASGGQDVVTLTEFSADRI